MNKFTQDSAISLSLAMVLCGVIWKASVTHTMAEAALKRVESVESDLSRRREINEEFKSKVISDLAVIKERLGVIK